MNQMREKQREWMGGGTSRGFSVIVKYVVCSEIFCRLFHRLVTSCQKETGEVIKLTTVATVLNVVADAMANFEPVAKDVPTAAADVALLAAETAMD